MTKYVIKNKANPPAYWTGWGYPNMEPLFEADKPEDAFKFLAATEASIYGLERLEMDFEVVATT